MFVEDQDQGVYRVRLAVLGSRLECSCNIHLSQTDSVKVTACGIYNRRNEGDRYFFNPFLNGDHSLKEVFKFIFQRMDVHYLIMYHDVEPVFVNGLTEAVRDSVAVIYGILFNLESNNFDENFELVEAIGKKTMRHNTRVDIKSWREEGLKKHWDRILRLNDISSTLGLNTSLQTASRLVDSYLAIITEEWSKAPFPQLYLDLFVCGSSSFDVEYVCGDRLKLMVDDEMTCIRVKHSRTNEVQEFRRKANP